MKYQLSSGDEKLYFLPVYEQDGQEYAVPVNDRQRLQDIEGRLEMIEGNIATSDAGQVVAASDSASAATQFSVVTILDFPTNMQDPP